MNERARIEKVLENYFEGYLQAEAGQVSGAFHPVTRLLSVDEGKLDSTEMGDWLRNLAERKARADVRRAACEILSVDITQEAAVAKVALTFPAFRFTDYLSLLRIGDDWRIVGKIYTRSATNCS